MQDPEHENDVLRALRRQAEALSAQIDDSQRLLQATRQRIVMAETHERQRRARYYDTIAEHGNPPPDLTDAIRTPTNSGDDWTIWVPLDKGRGEVLTVIDGRGRPDDPYGEAEVHRHLREAASTTAPVGEEFRLRLADAPPPLKAYMLGPLTDPLLVVSSDISVAERGQAARWLIRIARDRQARIDMIASQE